MLIESYSFGRMVIDGEEYRDDLMISGNEIHPKWIRESGHQLIPKDISWIVEKNPDILIVGKGRNGLMKVPNRTRKFLKDKDIVLWLGKTDEAMDHFNAKRNSGDEKTVSAAFHLTC